MHLGGTTIPTTIDNHGRYLFSKEVLGENGNGEAVVSNYASVLWTFPYMDMSDFQWICTTLMAGAYSVSYGSAQLRDDLGALNNYTSAVAYRPRYAYASSGGVFEVTWEIKRIR